MTGLRQIGWVVAGLCVLTATELGDGSSAARAKDAAATQQLSDDDLRRLFKRPPRVHFPENAPYAPQIATLGKMLFFDPRLSGPQNMSCATCHSPSFGWETSAKHAIGSMNVPLSRHAPTIENIAGSGYYMRDGAANTLEEQARGPITHPLEMNARMSDVVDRLSAVGSYRRWFQTMWPGEGVSERTILNALATFQRTVRSGWAPFDDWVAGDDAALTAQQRRGLALFVGAAGCAACHTGWALTDHGFHDIGLPTSDPGRGALEPGEPMMRHAFKTPTLRNITIRAPYMHDGSLASLREVLTHYALGGVDRPSRAPQVADITLKGADIDDVLEFLGALTAYEVDVDAPILPAN